METKAARHPGAIVVGASSGMGAAIAKELVGRGWRVAALARREEELRKLEEATRDGARASGGSLVTRVHDVAHPAEVPVLFEELARTLGGVELLVYAAGIMPEIGEQEYDTEKDLAILAVNTGGCIAWCNAAADLFRTQRKGTLVGISSIAGDRGRKGHPVYCTSKAAMNTYLEALRNRLSAFDVHVCTIRPGYIDTAMTQGMPNLFWLISADDAAKRILRAAFSGANVRYVPFRWMWVGLVLRLIPSFLFRRMTI